MKCPFCDSDDSKVIDSRLKKEGRQKARRRSCGSCKSRFTTIESYDDARIDVEVFESTLDEKLRQEMEEFIKWRKLRAWYDKAKTLIP